jgi:hypothetical protein
MILEIRLIAEILVRMAVSLPAFPWMQLLADTKGEEHKTASWKEASVGRCLHRRRVVLKRVMRTTSPVNVSRQRNKSLSAMKRRTVFLVAEGKALSRVINAARKFGLV